MKKIAVTLVLGRIIFLVCLCEIQAQNNATNATDSHEGCLFLTPLIRNGSIDAARKLSEVDPDFFLGLRSHSGFITVKEEYNSNLFFWFFPVAQMEEKPWIIWLQGGPGFSSLVGLFDLIGPIMIENGKVKLRNVTWASEYSLVFVDQPVGAGFSFTDQDAGYTTSEDEVGAQLYEFVQQFLRVFPALRGAPLFVAGESYAGKYVPALAVRIHRHRNDTHPINLKGVSIGNGLIDMRSMMRYGELCGALGLLAGAERRRLEALQRDVVALIDSGRYRDAANQFNATIEYIKKQTQVNIYNFQEEPNSSPSELEPFVERPDVRARIHAGRARFHLDNQLVYQNMLPDMARSSIPLVEELLDHYGVLSYSGQLDIILAYSLSLHTYELLRWSGRDAYERARRNKLFRRLDDARAPLVGYKKSGGNLVEVLVRGAGHAVPRDRPDVAKFVLDTFIRDFK